MAERHFRLRNRVISLGGIAAALLCAAAPIPVAAQSSSQSPVVIEDAARKSVTVDLSVLDQLGPPPTVPDLLRPTVPPPATRPLTPRRFPRAPSLGVESKPILHLPNIPGPPPLTPLNNNAQNNGAQTGALSLTPPSGTPPGAISLTPPASATQQPALEMESAAPVPRPKPETRIALHPPTPHRVTRPVAPAPPKQAMRTPPAPAPAKLPPPPPPPPGASASPTRPNTATAMPSPPTRPTAPRVPKPPAASVAPPPAPEPPKAPVHEARATPSPPAASAPARPAPKPAGEESLRLLFDPSEDKLTEKGGHALDGLVAQLEADKDLKLRIEAFASGEGGSASSARRLSLSRALAVRSHVMDSGISPARMEVRALGNRNSGGPPDRVDATIVPR